MNIVARPGFDLTTNGTAKIWRYMDFGKFDSLLSENALYFASASQFEDAFEGSITRKHYEFRLRPLPDLGRDTEFLKRSTSHAFRELPRLTKISCWHMNDYESAAMWQLYLRDGKGIAIQSSVSVPDHGILVGVDVAELIETIHLAPALESDYAETIKERIAIAGISVSVVQSEMNDEALF